MRDSETTVNMAFTLDQSIASWIERTALSKDMNKSQLARKIFREAMAAENKTKLVKSPKKGAK